jgi:5-methylcytosine-specific restriction endonuclease McrA
VTGLPPRAAVGGFCNPSELPKGPNGRALCRKCSTETAPPRKTFCSDTCITEWKIRTQPGFAKQQVKKRDDGICQLCRRDCFEGHRESRAYGKARGLLRLFEMDHIVPVVEGGGSCGLENLRTLCVPCHRRVTAELAARRAQARRSA